ncbi:MAG: serine hydrolase [Anaerolineales bacterium]|nr:serine hydrolase [Anaerolineales bacterium]
MSFERLEQFIFERASETNLPGVTIALIKDRDIIWKKAIGYKNLENGFAATPNTLYGIGSITKSFTVLAVLMLAEQGKLALDDPIEKYVPFTVKPFGEPIRIWHLLSHTSGIPALGHVEGVIRAMIGDSGTWFPAAIDNDLLAFLHDADDWVLTKPGERWFYLNEGYELVGAAIEQVSGLPYIDFLKQNILLPMGMTRSFFKKQNIDNDLDVAIPYVNTQGGKPVPSTYPYGSLVAAGGMISNVLDLSRIISMYLNWGAYDGGHLISKESLIEMQTPRIHTAQKDSPFGKFEYGLGLYMHSNFLGHRLVDHDGLVSTATAYMGFIPDAGVGVVVLTNSSGYSTRSLGQYGLAMLLGENPEELPFVKKERLMSKLAGYYETYKGTTRVQVRNSGDFLQVIEDSKFNKNLIPLIPVSLKPEKCTFYTFKGGNKICAEFFLTKDRTMLILERYAYRKIGDLLP